MTLALTLPSVLCAQNQEKFGVEGNASVLIEEIFRLKAESKIDSAFMLCKQLRSLDSIGDSVAFQLGVLEGDLWREKGDYGQAKTRYAESINAANTSIVEPRALSAIMNKMAGVSFRMGEHEEAEVWWKRCLELRKSSGDTVGGVRVLLNLASFHYNQDSSRLAEEYALQLFDLAESSGDTTAMLSALNLKSLANIQESEFEEAIQSLREAEDFLIEGQYDDSGEAIKFNLVEALIYQQETEAAIDALRIYSSYLEEKVEFRDNSAFVELEKKFIEEQARADLAQTQLTAQKNQNRLLLLISALLVVGALLYARFRRQQALQKARTEAVMQAREQEEERISQLLWTEIGKAMHQRGESPSVFKGDAKTLEGAVQAARYLSAQHFNPFLQVSLARAVDYACQLFGTQYEVKVATDIEDVPVRLKDRKALYKTFKRMLVDYLDTPGMELVKVTLSSEEGRAVFTVHGNIPPQDGTLYKSAEAEVQAMGGKMKSKPTQDGHQTRFKLPFRV